MAAHESKVEELVGELEKLRVEEGNGPASVTKETEEELTSLRDENYRLQEELIKLKG